MIDAEFKLKLIEVNANPSLRVCCPLAGEGDSVDLRLRVEAGAGPVLPSLVGREAKPVRKPRGEVKFQLIFEAE